VLNIIERNRYDQDRTLENVLVVSGHTDKVHNIAQAGDDQHARHRAEQTTATSEQVGATEDNGRN
jgi:hypothetical protein